MISAFRITLTIIMLQTVLSGCGRIWGWVNNPNLPTTPGGSFTPPVPKQILVSVQPTYSNAPNWMDYVRNDGVTVFNAANVVCDGTESSWSQCLHGGEFRSVSLSTVVANCSGVTVSDSLGLLKWACVMKAGVPTAMSYGLVPNMGIKNALSLGGLTFATNSVQVYQGGYQVGFTSPTIWWTNNLVALPDNHLGPVQDLTGYPSGTILTLATSRSTYGYGVVQNRIGIVTLSNVILSWAAGAPKNCDYSGGRDGTNSNRMVLCIGSIATPYGFQYIEANTDCNAGAADFGVYAYQVKTLNIHASAAQNCNASGGGFWVRYSPVTRFQSNLAQNNSGVGLEIESNCSGSIFTDDSFVSNSAGGLIFNGGADQSFVSNIRSFNNSGDGIDLGGVANLTAVNLVSANNGGYGIVLGFNLTGSRIVQALSAGNGNDGFFVSSFTTSDLVFSSAVNNAAFGVDIQNPPTTSYFHNLVMANNTSSGFFTNEATTAIVDNLATVDNGTYGVDVSTTGKVNMSGFFAVGGNATDCHQAGGTGILNTNCTTTHVDGSSNYGGISSALLRTARTSTNSYQGEISITDPLNLSNTNGQSNYGGITDWLNFLFPLRLWGKFSISYPGGTGRGRCGSGTCAIWDWSLIASDSTFLNKGADAVTLSSPIANGSACPANIAQTTTDANGTIILANAVEMVNEPYLNPNGNNNGLCDGAMEACVYAPNIGAYQGHGGVNIAASCTVSSGALSGVTIYSYLRNGE